MHHEDEREIQLVEEQRRESSKLIGKERSLLSTEDKDRGEGESDPLDDNTIAEQKRPIEENTVPQRKRETDRREESRDNKGKDKDDSNTKEVDIKEIKVIKVIQIGGKEIEWDGTNKDYEEMARNDETRLLEEELEKEKEFVRQKEEELRKREEERRYLSPSICVLFPPSHYTLFINSGKEKNWRSKERWKS